MALAETFWPLIGNSPLLANVGLPYVWYLGMAPLLALPGAILIEGLMLVFLLKLKFSFVIIPAIVANVISTFLGFILIPAFGSPIENFLAGVSTYEPGTVFLIGMGIAWVLLAILNAGIEYPVFLVLKEPARKTYLGLLLVLFFVNFLSGFLVIGAFLR